MFSGPIRPDRARIPGTDSNRSCSQGSEDSKKVRQVKFGQGVRPLEPEFALSGGLWDKVELYKLKNTSFCGPDFGPTEPDFRAPQEVKVVEEGLRILKW